MCSPRVVAVVGLAALVTDGYATDDLEHDGWIKIQDNILVP